MGKEPGAEELGRSHGMLGGPCRGSSLVPGAAKYCKLLQTLQPPMMIMDEAMEILEAHILAHLSTSALLGTGSRYGISAPRPRARHSLVRQVALIIPLLVEVPLIKPPFSSSSSSKTF